MANYTGTDWVTRTCISTDILSTIDEGLGQAVDDIKTLNADLTDKAGYYRISDSSTSDVAQKIQDEWTNIPQGTTLLYLDLAQRSSSICSKYNDANGAAIIFGYASAANPPKLVRVSGGTWTTYNFTVTSI